MPAKADDVKKMNGTWTVAEAHLAGMKLPEDFSKTVKLTLKDGAYSTEVGDNKDEGTVKLIAGTKPALMEIEGTVGPNKGKKFQAIYELDGDKMRVCYALDGKTKPTEFKSTAENGMFLVTYVRAK
jgi:uncharacterized protein (TIGR03067 family)